MGLVNPWLLFGLAALSVPVLIHLVQREEHSGRKFPSLMFVRRIRFEIKRRRRIRDPMLLALRCFALAAVVIAFASPYFNAKLSATSASAIERDVVILLDRSYSMSHPDRWKRATAAAGERLQALGSGERAALVTFQGHAQIVSELSDDKTLLLGALNRIQPGEGRTGYAAAFGAANRMLASSEAKQHELVLISDLQLSALDDSSAIPLGEKVALDIVAVDAPVGANVTVTDARLTPQRDESVEDRLRVRIENTGDAPIAEARLELVVDGRVAETRTLELDAGETRALTLPLVLAADRPTPITLQVGPDALPADDRYHLVLAPRRPIAVALIEPRHPRAHQGMYFEQALRLAREPGVRVRRVGLEQVTEALLEDFEVVVLDDVAITPGPPSDAIATFVDRGGGVIAVARPSVGAAWPGGNGGFLPGVLGAESTAADSAHRVVPSTNGHPFWAAAGLERGMALSAAQIGARRALVPGADDRVLAQLDNGAPLLLERIIGGGRALALATTADPRWNTLVLEPGFVPFVQATVAYLAGREGWRDAYLAGEVVDLAQVANHLPAGSEWRMQLAAGGAVVVETPSGVAERIERPGGALFATRIAGMHEAHRVGRRGASLPFAVNVTRTESVLAAFSPAELERRIVRRARLELRGNKGFAGADGTDPFNAARWLLLLAGLTLIAESLIASRISVRRAPAASGAVT
jgi:hypothetical protein